jgi:hypothetical protein
MTEILGKPLHCLEVSKDKDWQAAKKTEVNAILEN